MMMAAAFVKPLTTGCDRKLTTRPRRSTPSPSCTTPTIKASAMAYPMYRSLPTVASGASEAKVISDTTATGPVASWRLEPKRAASIGGRKAAYRP